MTFALALFLILIVAGSITQSQSSLVLPVEDDAIRYLAQGHPAGKVVITV